MTTAFTDGEMEADENWEPAKAAAADYLAKEIQFLDNASMLFNRYIELREPLKLALIKSRHAYLKSVIEAAGGTWEPAETSAPTPTEGQALRATHASHLMRKLPYW